jgi:acetyl-CoA carboxylase beta subunit/acetyl-CoA carboxylase alpha subunit
MPRLSTDHLLADLLDEGTWEAWAKPPSDFSFDAGYEAELTNARDQSGVSESVRTGAARVAGHEVVVVASDFDFLAGSIGAAAASQIVTAFDKAISLGLPVIGLPTSGGTRMQEGTPTFLRMAAIASAVQRHKNTGLPYLVYLRNPTTGGVFASWGSLGDVTFGEPGALTGFLGPRVYEGLYGHPFPAGVQTSEALADAGVIDGVATPGEWRLIVSDSLSSWADRPALPAEAVQARSPIERAVGIAAQGPVMADLTLDEEPAKDPWRSVLETREPQRAGVHDLLDHADNVVFLSGDQAGGNAEATTLAIARFQRAGCVFVGQDRVAQLSGKLIGPADLRVARRGMRLAECWGLPLVTVVDTQGGELSVAAELGGLAGEIARCLADLSSLKVPTISVLLGGGGGGAALALLPADRVIAVADAWVMPLPPEGASLIRHRTTDRASEMARSQFITVADLRTAGAVDVVLAALGTTDWSDVQAGQKIGRHGLAGVAMAIGAELHGVGSQPPDIAARAARWSEIG